MPRQFKPPKDLSFDRMFETRSEAWEAVGLSLDMSQRAVKRAQRDALILVPLVIGILVAYDHRAAILGKDTAKSLQTPLQIVTVLLLVGLGWALARAVGRLAGPTFLRRMDPATAGTVGFLIRLATIGIMVLAALSVGGVHAQALFAAGAFTAVILGLAAQQTLGNVFAGMVLLSARPFRVGERVRLQAGNVGGSVEGIVSSLGLLYTTFKRGADQIMVPNNVVLAAAVVPVKEPDSVDVRVRLTSGVRPSQVQAILDSEVSTATRNPATVLLEEIDGDDVIVRVQATPELSNEGAKLADEIMAALTSVTGEHAAASERDTAAGQGHGSAGAGPASAGPGAADDGHPTEASAPRRRPSAAGTR